MEHKKVLEITDSMNVGGAETFLMNVLRNTDAGAASLDFAQKRFSHSAYDGEILSLGGRVFYCASKIGLAGYIFNLFKLMRNNKYDAVHCHMHYYSAFGLLAAYLAGVPVRVCHSHSTQSGRKNTFVRKIYEFTARRMILALSTDLFACSAGAGRALYGDTACFKVIPNGINCRAFSYNPLLRAETRKKLGIEENFVLTHIGRFNNAKNHTFLIDIFAALLKTDKTAKLMLIGAGELEQDVKNKVKALAIEKSVMFLGLRKDTPAMLMAADVFVMPSLYEGLPLAGIEAQCAGLPVVFTQTLTKEMDIFNAFYVPLDIAAWTEKIAEIKNINIDRSKGCDAVKKAGFDACGSAKVLLKVYGGVK